MSVSLISLVLSNSNNDILDYPISWKIGAVIGKGIPKELFVNYYIRTFSGTTCHMAQYLYCETEIDFSIIDNGALYNFSSFSYNFSQVLHWVLLFILVVKQGAS